MTFDYLVVGAGLTGATIARVLHDEGLRVLVVERRAAPGGNVHDHLHASGIRVHTYGPHYFRTDSDAIWSFVNRFAEFYRYEARLTSRVGDRYEPWPLTRSQVTRLVGDDWQPGFTGTPSNFEEASLRLMPRAIYETFVKGYTQKQWGIAPHCLAASLVQRFQIRADDDDRLSQKRYQGLPIGGYAALMRRLLSTIPTVLNCDYLRERTALPKADRIVYTGPIDDYFGAPFGRLRYRRQCRVNTYLPEVAQVQPNVQVNNPDLAAGPHVRTIEWKHLMPAAEVRRARGTVITTETAADATQPDEYEYPFPDEENQQLYRRYRTCAASLDRVLICGRLGEYRYYDMDQSIGRALHLARRLLQERQEANAFAVVPRTISSGSI